MSRPVILRPAADADIEATHDELERVQAGLGGRFVARVREVLERIEAMPEMYGPVWQDVRAARLRKFRHMVYYVAFGPGRGAGGAPRLARPIRVAVARLIRAVAGRTGRRSRPPGQVAVPGLKAHRACGGRAASSVRCDMELDTDGNDEAVC